MSNTIKDKDPAHYPLSEFYTRFESTTSFQMKEPLHWNAYYRSHRARSFRVQGKDNSLFTSPSVIRDHQKGDYSYHAHVGGYSNPFKSNEHSKQIKGGKPLESYDKHVRDELIQYKRKMCVKALISFNKACSDNKVINHQPARMPGKRLYKEKRPIVIYENNYPCILVQSPVFNPKHNENYSDKKEAAIYWNKHPKQLQKLLMSFFVAMMNTAAKKENIPIEIVMRASFSHNIPSVSETENTFRISIGLVPKAYSKLVGKTLFNFYQFIDENINNQSKAVDFKLGENLQQQIVNYNMSKITEKIENNDKYKSIRNKKLSYESLYKNFLNINENIAVNNKNKGKKGTKGTSRFVPVNLKNKTIWQVMRQPADSMGKSLLSELFRSHANLEQFTNMLIDALEKDKTNPVESVLINFIDSYLDYSTGKARIKEACKKDCLEKQSERKWIVDNSSINNIISKDKSFRKIVNILFVSLNAKSLPRHLVNLYTSLEKAHNNFIAYHCTDESKDGYGSDSDCEIDYLLEDSIKSKKNKFKLYGKKFRLNNGMSTIVMAYYLAQYFLVEIEEIKSFYTVLDNMYYETNDALKLIKNYDDVKIVIRKRIYSEAKGVLLYDLNYCNSSNRLNVKTLKQELNDNKPTVAILDYTSTVTSEIAEAIVLCFNNKVEVVLLVNSGLKNDQGGADINPYGELRILTKEEEYKNNLYKKANNALKNSEPVPASAHQIVRGYKKRGLVFHFAWLKDTGAVVKYRSRSKPKRHKRRQ